MEDQLNVISKASLFLKERLPEWFKPEILIIGGSGLAALEEAIYTPSVQSITDGKWVVPYEDIPGWPVSTVAGHAGKLICGRVGAEGPCAILMSGRAHLYEGNTLQAATFPIRVLSQMGVKTLIVTNAAGGLNRSFKVGDVVLLNDHINFPGLSGINPLQGPNLASFGPRFVALSDTYDLQLRQAAHKAWKEVANPQGEMALHEGVYAFVGGPNYETRAECRMLAILGADMVGMSTVPEVLVAAHCGIRVLALSLVTNMSVLEASKRGDDPELAGMDQVDLEEVMKEGKANHEEVMDVGRNAAIEIKKLIVKIIESEFPREA